MPIHSTSFPERKSVTGKIPIAAAMDSSGDHHFRRTMVEGEVLVKVTLIRKEGVEACGVVGRELSAMVMGMSLMAEI